MADYISREDARAFAITVSTSFGRIDAVPLDDLDELPAADVRPVVRGKWTRVDYEPCGHDYICSECGCKSDGAWNFCHDCGADMREDNDGR